MVRLTKGILLSFVILTTVACGLFATPKGSPTEAINESPIESEQLNIEIPTLILPTQTQIFTQQAATPTPIPAHLNPKGPFILFAGASGVWITNPDGSALTHVSEYEFKGDLRGSISPTGDRLAQVVRTDEGLDLVIISIPDGKTENVTRLINITQEEEAANPTSKKAFAYYAIQNYSNVAWQPGSGQNLAFTGELNGISSDLYLFNTQTSKFSQLTDGPSQAIMPIWSPNGQYILHYGVSWVPPFGGAIVGPNRLDGVWAVQVSDGKVITLPKPKGTFPHFVGWLDEMHYVSYDSDDACYSKNLRSFDVVTTESVPIMKYSFYYGIARSTENGAFLFAGAEDCVDSPGEGTFLLAQGENEPTKLLDKRAYEVSWLPESKVFQAYPEVLFSADGNTRYDPPVYDASYHPAISKAGYQAWEVIQNRKGRVEVRTSGSDWKSIQDGLVESLIWDPIDGRTLFIVLKDGSLFAASYPDFSPKLLGTMGENIIEAIRIN